MLQIDTGLKEKQDKTKQNKRQTNKNRGDAHVRSWNLFLTWANVGFPPLPILQKIPMMFFIDPTDK